MSYYTNDYRHTAPDDVAERPAAFSSVTIPIAAVFIAMLPSAYG